MLTRPSLSSLPVVSRAEEADTDAGGEFASRKISLGVVEGDAKCVIGTERATFARFGRGIALCLPFTLL